MGGVFAVSIGWIVFDHPVGGRLSQSLGILVYERVLVVICLCIVDEALAVALDLCKGGIFTILQLSLTTDC